MGGWTAVGTATDRRGLALSLARAHEAMMDGGPRSFDGFAGLRPVVERSWRRAAVAGVDPCQDGAPVVLGADEVAQRWSAHPLSAAEPLIRRMLEDLGDDGHLAAVCDADGTLLFTSGRPATLDVATEGGLRPGTSWDENAIGTNGLGTALAERHPVQVFAGEHFATPNHPWVCSAAPIHDPLSGAVIGALDISGDFSSAHPHSLAVVTMAARTIEQGLLAGAQLRARRALQLPEASLTVLGGDRGLLRFGRQETALSRRHTELLVLLWLRPEGVTAEQLALELYGEQGRPGSIRTEMHRLRGHLGSLLGERPYRLLGHVDCDVRHVEALVREGNIAAALQLYRGPALPSTEVPRLVELRGRLDDAVRAGVLSSGDPALLEAWLGTSAGRDDYEVSRRLMIQLGRDDPRRAAERARLRRLAADGAGAGTG